MKHLHTAAVIFACLHNLCAAAPLQQPEAATTYRHVGFTPTGADVTAVGATTLPRTPFGLTAMAENAAVLALLDAKEQQRQEQQQEEEEEAERHRRLVEEAEALERESYKPSKSKEQIAEEKNFLECYARGMAEFARWSCEPDTKTLEINAAVALARAEQRKAEARAAVEYARKRGDREQELRFVEKERQAVAAASEAYTAARQAAAELRRKLMACERRRDALIQSRCVKPSPEGDSETARRLSPAAQAVDALPLELAGWRRTGQVSDMDRQPGSFGLGGSLKYEPTDGSRAFATVFIYDLGQHRSPDGADSQDAVAQMRQAAGDIEGAVRLGRYRSAMPAGSLTVPGPEGATRLRCETYRVVQLDDLTTSDGVCVSILQGHYQKVRLTSWLFPDPRQAGMQAAAMLSAMIDAQSNPKSRADEAVELERGARD